MTVVKRESGGAKSRKTKHKLQKGRVIFAGKEQITQVNLTEFSIKNTKIYGSYTIEQRALSDFRDGLKPVHRRILWSMFNLGLHNSGGFKKCARTVGDVIGKYHPHGDAACYQAMVSIACSVAIDKKKGGMKTDWTNTPCPLVDGQGNFGGIGAEDRAAAARYTESKLSKFADMWMLDPDYLAVSTMVPNFDGEEKEPVILPAKLPYILLGGCEGIATGVSTFIPTFSQESVTRIVKKLLTEGEPATSKMCMKYLKFKFSNGGVCTSTPIELLSYFKTGKGSLTFQPVFEVAGDIVTLKSSAPRFSIEKQLTKLAAINGVILASDDSDRHVGRNVNITLKKRLEPKDRTLVLAKIDKEITTSLSLQTAVTERLDDGETVKFRYTTIPALLNKWIEWRIQLELKVVAYRISKSERDLERLTLLQLAAQNKEIMKAMLDKDDPIKFIISKLKFNGAKLTDAQANFLLDIRFRTLTKTSVKKLLEDIKSVKLIIVSLKKDLKDPNSRILKSL